jgi:hypothetical protein
MFRRFSLVLILTILLAGCSLLGAAQPTPTIDLNAVRTLAAQTALAELTRLAPVSTSTPEATATETTTPTPQPTPTIEVILSPVPGVATNNLTVRSSSGKGGDNLGGIFFNQKMSVLGRNPNATWFYIEWQDSPTGKAWVTARAVDLQGFDIGRLPIVYQDDNNNLTFFPPVIWEITGTPLPVPPVPTGNQIRPATVNQTANVRVCPSKGCSVIGYLEFGQALNMTGRTWGNEWAQFDYPSGPEGKGWISREAIEITSEGFGGLPYFDDMGRLVTPEPPTATPDPNLSPTPSNTPEPTPAGPRAVVDDITAIYAEPSSLSTQLGEFKAKDEVFITGIALNGLWYQIQYPALTDGRAYVSQKYIRVMGDMRYLPYFDNQGNLLPTPAK